VDRYRKFWVAGIGALAQILAVVDQAQTAGVIPEAWQPWVIVAIAVATAVGVERIPNAKPAADL
jgi:hypothetical protein